VDIMRRERPQAPRCRRFAGARTVLGSMARKDVRFWLTRRTGAGITMPSRGPRVRALCVCGARAAPVNVELPRSRPCGTPRGEPGRTPG
jgi:hypothetical protein